MNKKINFINRRSSRDRMKILIKISNSFSRIGSNSNEKKNRMSSLIKSSQGR